MKTILILGAGLMQKPAIEAASRLGYKVAVADGNPNAVCVPLADIFEPVDLKDREALLSFARKLDSPDAKNGGNLAGVFTAGTDFSASVSYVAENMKLPGHSFEAAINASDKVCMRSCFAAAGVSSPCFFNVTEEDAGKNADEIMDKAGFSAFPLVVKPVDNMGGRGCRMVRSKEELSDAIKVAVQFSRTRRAILEEYMQGREFSIDALVFDDEVTITGFADRHIYYPPYFIEMGHTMSTVLDEKDWCALAKTFRDGIKALGLTHGAAKADIKLTPSGPMIGEIAARLSGGYMSGWTFPYASGMNLTEEALLLALGKKPEALIAQRERTLVEGVWNIKTEKTSAERAWLSIPGRIEKVVGLPAPNGVLCDVLPRCGEGDEVTFPVNNVGKCGNIISCSANYDEAVAAAKNGIAGIVPVLVPGNSETDAFLAAPLDTEFPPSAFTLPQETVSALVSEYNGKVFSSSEAVNLPEIIVPYAENIKDWNKRSIKKTLELFDVLKPSFKDMPSDLFWRTLLRGGIQGILYMATKYAGDK
ncbi:MAG: ATP-grasp domain-containing protein [Spirochaetaceae bacterium]|nr:ATP-grasp domain-containing protein [Spirochaetaceae bacterium]